MKKKKVHAIETDAAIKNMETCVKRVFSTFSPDGYSDSRKDLLLGSIISEMIERAFDARKKRLYSIFRISGRRLCQNRRWQPVYRMQY